MLEIHVHGRTGQGTHVACQLLAAAFHRAGAWAQMSIGCEGGCGGGLVTAVLCIDPAPIALDRPPGIPDHLIVLDPTLLTVLPSPIVQDGGAVVVNTPLLPCSRAPRGARVVAVDATAIAQRTELDEAVGTASLGAFAAATGLVTMEHLLAAVREDSPTAPDAHASACAEGYQEARALVEVLR